MSAIQKNLVVRATRVIDDYLRREFVESIDGVSIESAVKMVDLTIGYTPVVMNQWHDERFMSIPRPTRVQTDGKVFAAVWPEIHDFQILSDRHHRECRARFLLLRGMFYRHFDRYCYPEQRQIVEWYFNGQMWRPKKGSELERALLHG